jgi:hypothetical protein
MLLELKSVLELAQSLAGIARVEVLHQVQHEGKLYPIHGFSFGSEDPKAPTFGIVGGIHGLERIGTHVAISFINYLQSRWDWDQTLKDELKKIRIYFVPLMNPVGMEKFSRANHAGVDLMRNAPLSSVEASFGVGGQGYSKYLPWFRGNPTQTFLGMEPEVQALNTYLDCQTLKSSCNVILDLHSGFGMVDQIWFPFAHTQKPFPQVAQVRALNNLMDQVLPNHVYRFEPQSRHYCTHGDLWDYRWLQNQDPLSPHRTFLPLTLEMGSWNWMKKNPFQLFSFSGAFNPMKPHRQARALRRHIPLFDFLIRAIISNSVWSDLSLAQRLKLEEQASFTWYGRSMMKHLGQVAESE